MPTAIQRAFAGGEISPSLYGRVDQAKYQTGLATCRNFIVQKWGGASNRAGTEFVAELRDGTFKGRAIPFAFNADQTYILLFTRFAMRVARQGVQLTDVSATITNVTRASPAVVTTSAAHNFSNGDEVAISGVLGMTQVNGRNFKVANVAATTFELTDVLDGAAIDSSAYTPYASAGTAARIYTLATPYTDLDLAELQHVQSADVITLVHPNHQPRELRRSGHTDWALVEIVFAPDIPRPTNAAGTAGSAGSQTFKYKVTAVADSDTEESLSCTQATTAISSITQTNPVVVTTTAAHGYSNGDGVLILTPNGMAELNNREFEIANITATTFELRNENGTGYTPYVAAGTVARTHIRIASAGTPTSSSPHTLTWDAVEGASEYNVYKEKDGTFGWVGVATDRTYKDIGTTPDQTDNPPIARDPFSGVGNKPSTVSYYQQRIVYANTDNKPETIVASRTGYFHNFTKQFPRQDDDAIIFSVGGRNVNEVRHLLDLRRLVVFTVSGEVVVSGDDAGVLTPFSVNARQNSYSGSGTLSPIVVDEIAIFQQARGGSVRSLYYNFDADGYLGNDLTTFSPHLFENYTLVDWAFQKIPHSITWAVRSDGTLLGLTFIKEHDIWGWHRHDTDGTFENVAVVPEGSEDRAYFIVKRTVNGKTRRYLERMASRRLDDIKDIILMDSALTFDGRNSNALHTMTLSGGTLWTADETLTLTSSLTQFVAGDVGNDIQMTGADGGYLRFNIVTFSSGTVVTGKADRTVPASLRTTATSTWTRAVDDLTGLWHLEGKSVSIYGDGFVVANPNNPTYTSYTVTNGAVTLSAEDGQYGVIHVGLPYLSDMETLDLDQVDGETLIDKARDVQEVTFIVEDTRGLWVGHKAPVTSTTDGLTEKKDRDQDDAYDSPPALKTGPLSINIRGSYSNGRVFLRVLDPVPASILAVAPKILSPMGR